MTGEIVPSSEHEPEWTVIDRVAGDLGITRILICRCESCEESETPRKRWEWEESPQEELSRWSE